MLTPYCHQELSFTWWDNAFTEQELSYLQSLARTQNQQATVGGRPDEETLKKIRRSKVGWLTNNSENLWVFEKLSHVVSDLNARFYKFDLTGFGEKLQLTNYQSEELGTYTWHQDFGSLSGPSRKLSLVVQLSSPQDYEGGNLEVLTKNESVSIEKRRGLITVFPSWVLHRVTPVTKGDRQTLVAWVSGPPFK